MHESRLSICFVAHNAYGALSGRLTGHVGGIERQQSLMARWLAAQGHRVSMVTWDEGQDDESIVGGVRIIKLCSRDAGWPGLRFLHPRWSSLDRALRAADAEVYYYNCGDMALGQIVLWCRWNVRRCVYSAASDADCTPALPLLKPTRERVLYRHGLRRADRIIVQTGHQQSLLRDGFGVDSVVIPLPCEDLCGRGNVIAEPIRSPSPRIVWVGRISREKRLEWLLEIAKRCPECVFDVVGAANVEEQYPAGLAKQASALPNVTMHGRVSHAEMGRFYQGATALCCTSCVEGFPNTFLEAWSHGVPVVTTFDPDDVVARRGLGWVGHGVEELAGHICAALTSPEAWRRASTAARAYYEANHTMEAVLPRFVRVFQEVVR